jgi:proprotein convertase subtilisin/kexin type 5
LGICRIPCDAKHIYNIASQSCVCLPQYFQMADGSCSTCPLHSTYSATTQQCVCDQGYLLNLGLCTTACNPYEQFVNGSCVCKPGYYLIGYSCGVCPPTQAYDATYRICRTPCKTNEVWDITIRACRCLPAYYLVGGICSQCDSKTQVYNQKLQCCDCIDGYQKVSGQGCNGVCTPICNINEDWISGRCVCKPGFFLINNFCTQCPAGQIYDIYQRVCRVQCGTNQVYNFNSGKCDCAQSYYIVQGACSQCLTGETYDSYTQTCSVVPCQGVNEFYSASTQQCVCKSMYVRIKGVCTNCPPGYYYDSYSDQCLCKPGFKEVGGFCNPICPSDQTYVNGVCQCNNGAKLYNGKCITPNLCPLNSHLDVNSGCCVCNAGFSVINGQCSSYQYCGLNGYLRYGQCYCNDGFFWVLGSCQPCGTNQAFNGVVCECYVGYNRDVNGNCVKSNFAPNCYNNERYDSTLQACVCTAGSVFLRGSCQTIPSCPQNAYFDGVQCVCNSGFLLQSGQCVTVNVVIPSCPANSYFNGVSCTCNSGFYQSAINACAACATGTSWDGTQCSSASACANGYVLNSASGQCEPSAPSCGSNAAWNGATCVCSSSYSMINGQCQQCGNGTTFDGTQCSSSSLVNAPITCGSNQIYVNGSCACSAGFYNIQGSCLACPANTQWNGIYCVCTNSDASQWCLGQPYSSFSNGSCSCQSGYVSVNGICTASS